MITAQPHMQAQYKKHAFRMVNWPLPQVLLCPGTQHPWQHVVEMD